MSEIRFDKIRNQYVIIAPERMHRPNLPKAETLNNTQEKCPFCAGHEEMTPPEIFALRDNAPNTKEWKTRVVPNLYKAVQIEEENASHQEGFFEYFKGFGAHEILIDSPCHDCTPDMLTEEAIENWLRTMVIRLNDLACDKRLISLHIFKNSGQNAGATQAHPHTQIIALPMMPMAALDFLQRNQAYYAKHGRGIVEDVVYNERTAQTRVIGETGAFLAYCPYASAFAFEVIIAPLRKCASLNRCSQEELSDLAEMIKSVFVMLRRQLGTFDYNIGFYLAPLNRHFENEAYMEDLDKNFTFYLRIMPRIYTIAGFEIAAEMAINSVEPENCAKLLRGD